MNHEELNKIIWEKFKIKNVGRKDNAYPWMTKEKKRENLPELYVEFGYKRGAEIGVYRGTHSMQMCQGVPGLELYCIDPYSPYNRRNNLEDQERRMRKAQERLAPYNATFIRKPSMEALADFEDRSLDFVYIDGNHLFDFIMMDLIHWPKKVKSGGMIAVHDYFHLGDGGVVEAVDAYTRCHCIAPWYVTQELAPTAFWVNP